jgi:hypothetical protein
MFALIALAAAGKDQCALTGHCAPAQQASKDITSFASHSSNRGLYTEDQVKSYRDCSNDYTSKFVAKYNSSKQFLGYEPSIGSGAVEKFRMCWEPITLTYPPSPKYG